MLALQAYQRGVHADWKADDNKRKRYSEEKQIPLNMPVYPVSHCCGPELREASLKVLLKVG